MIQTGDSIGGFSNTFTFKALVPYLSEYGKKLLFQKNANQAHLENIFNKVLYGKNWSALSNHAVEQIE